MSSVSGYFQKSIKIFFLILASLIAFVVFCGVVDLFLPIKIHNGLVIFILSSFHEIFTVIGLIICLVLAYKIFKIIKAEEPSKQKFLKVIPTIIFWPAFFLLISIFVGGDDGGIDCNKFNYNNKLNGGTKEFNGKKYTINICGSGVNNNRYFGDGMEKVQLTILSEQGDILAKRRYKVFWDGQPGHEPITIRKDSITYQDDDEQLSYTVNIPPKFIDWIQTKVSIFFG